MGVSGRPSVLVAVDPDLLRQVLVEILIAVGEDDVTAASGRPPPRTGRRFSAAIVSDPLEDDVADVILVLPPSGDVKGEVRTVDGTTSIDMSGPLAVLEALDRICPTSGGRAAKAAAWGNGTRSWRQATAAGPGGSFITPGA